MTLSAVSSPSVKTLGLKEWRGNGHRADAVAVAIHYERARVSVLRVKAVRRPTFSTDTQVSIDTVDLDTLDPVCDGCMEWFEFQFNSEPQILNLPIPALDN